MTHDIGGRHFGCVLVSLIFASFLKLSEGHILRGATLAGLSEETCLSQGSLQASAGSSGVPWDFPRVLTLHL